MTHIIDIRPDVTNEEMMSQLLGMGEDTLRQAVEFFNNADVADDKPNFSVESGAFVYSDGTELEFRNYKGLVSGTYDDNNGDRWWITYDGGHVNIGAMLRMLTDLRKDAENA